MPALPGSCSASLFELLISSSVHSYLWILFPFICSPESVSMKHNHKTPLLWPPLPFSTAHPMKCFCCCCCFLFVCFYQHIRLSTLFQNPSLPFFPPLFFLYSKLWVLELQFTLFPSLDFHTFFFTAWNLLYSLLLFYFLPESTHLSNAFLFEQLPLFFLPAYSQTPS